VMVRSATVGLTTRPYEDADEARVLDLLVASLGQGPAGARTSEFFRWKHLDNPFGRSFMLVAEADGNIVGIRSFLRWEFTVNGQIVPAVRAVDTATHPSYQRRGLFRRLTLEALDMLKADTAFVFNTPNDKSLPGYLKMGWDLVGRVPVRLRIGRPLRLARSLLPRVASSLRDRPVVDAENPLDVFGGADASQLLQSTKGDSRIRSNRSIEYLRWRYGSASGLGYYAVSEVVGGRLAGVAIFRVRPRGQLWETTISELLVQPGYRGIGRSLVAKIVAAARVDYVVSHFSGSATANRATRSSGFLPTPAGIRLAVNSLSPTHPDPRSMSSWGLSLGDVEVF
jgi:GNAT superfamily N-acetyltransferase